MTRTNRTGLIAAIIAAFLFASPAKAALLLDVTYTGGSIVSGPLSFGLISLPTEVNATFTFASTPLLSVITWDKDDVLSASVIFGDASWTTSDLASFSMETDDDEVSSLTYAFDPVASLTAEGPVVLNFPLTIRGTHKATNEPFEYRYENSTQSLVQIPEPSTLTIFGLGLAGLGFMRRRRKLH